jgi:hypothetical protein
MLNLKVDRYLRREYFTSDAIYNGSACMTTMVLLNVQQLARLLQEMGRIGLCFPYQLNQSTVSAGVCTQHHFLRFHNAVNGGRTCIYFGKLRKNDVLRPL